MIPNTKNGFSLIELLISIAILAIFASVVSMSLGGYKKSADLNSSSRIIESLLRNAQSKALSGKESKNWGISFDSASGKITSLSDDGITKIPVEENYLPQTVRFNSASLSGGCDEIIFLRPAGSTVRDCVIRIEDAFGPGTFKDISIKTSGFVGINP